MSADSSSLKNFLESSRLISRSESDDLWQESNGNETMFAQLLLEHGQLTEDDLQRARSHVWGLPLIDLTNHKLAKEALYIIPEPFARHHNVIGCKLSDQGLEVALLDPSVVEEVAAILPFGVKLLPRLTTTTSIRAGLKEYRRILGQQFGDQIQTLVRELKSGGESSSANNLLDLLLLHAGASNTSVIYLEPGGRDLLVRYRLGSRLYDAMVLPISTLPSLAEVAREKLSTQASFLPTVFGQRIVIRLDGEERGSNLESLGVRSGAIEYIQAALRGARGLILISGQSSSGKSTLGYTLLENLQTIDKGIVTIEDVIARRLARVSQTVVGSSLGLGAASLLRAASRQDPEVVMVDEIRDQEVASLTLNFGLARGLAIAVVKGKSTIDTIYKFSELAGSASALASGLKVVVSCAVIRRLGAAREKYFLTSADIESLQDQFNLDLVLETSKLEKIVEGGATWSTIPFYKPSSSDGSEGYDGNVGVYEVLPISLSIKDMLIAGSSEKELRAEAKRLGCLTLAEEGLILAARGLTTIDEVLRTL